MKVATRVKVIATLSVAISMATATKGNANDRTPSRAEAGTSASDPAFVKIDEALRANPYFKSGLRVGLAAGRDRGSLLNCRDATLSEVVDIEVEYLNQEPYMLGYLKGFIPAYEESRQLVLSQCIKDVPAESEADVSYAAARMAKVKDILSNSSKPISKPAVDSTERTPTARKLVIRTSQKIILLWFGMCRAQPSSRRSIRT